MENINTVKTGILGTIGIVGSIIANYLGGWDMFLQALIIFMTIDYITGLAVAGIFHNSSKSENGALESRAGWKGLCRKCMTLLFVLIAALLDKVAEVDITRNAVCIYYISNEVVSITENATLMNLPVPGFIKKTLEILNARAEGSEIK